jgi:pimeloyl-ACP methyl ester carboxylesterase
MSLSPINVLSAGVCVVAVAAWVRWRRSVTPVLPRDLSDRVKSRFVRLSDGSTVHCFVGGPASGVAAKANVLFVHGFGCNSLEFAPCLVAMSAHNNVIAPDRVLFCPPDRDRTHDCEGITAELRDLLAQLGVDASLPLILCGHSYGGLLCSHFAAAAGVRVSGLVLVDPAHEDQFKLCPRDFRVAFAMTPVVFAMLRFTSFLGLPRALRGFLPFPPLNLYPLAERELAQCAYTDVDGSVWRRVADELSGCTKGMEQMRALRVASPLPKTTPVTVLVASARGPSPTFFPERLTAMFTQLASSVAQPPNAVVLAPRSNHWIHVEQPELVIDALETMVSQLQQQEQQ